MGSYSEISKPSSITFQDDNAELMAGFRNLGLGDCRKTSLNHNFEVGSSSSSLSMYSEQSNQNEEIFNGWRANGDFQRRPINSSVAESQPESPIRQESLGAYHRFNDGASYQPSYLQSVSGNFIRKTMAFKQEAGIDFTEMTNDGANYLGYNPITSPRTPLPSYTNYGSPCAYAHQTLFSNKISNGYIYPTNGVSSYTNGYNLNNNGVTSSGLTLDCFPKEVDFVKLAMTPDGSHILNGLLIIRDNETRNLILFELLDSIPELMTDQYGCNVFRKLIGSCNEKEFHIIAMKLTSEDRFLLDAPFNIHGTYSVQNFIKKLKKSPMAYTVTHILSKRFFEMMTHPQARHVIKQCINVLGFLPNMVLYEAAIYSCYALAVHNVGCVSINDCIDFIMGPQRDILLQLLADQSAYLASDPSGNYVVQHVLKTQNPMIVDRVCHSLRGHYRELSAKKGGSHIIEMCLKYSSIGMNFAVQEFLENSKALVRLAKDEFGNYVVQTMLNVTKLENIRLYEALVKALEPHFRCLKLYKTGRRVVALIRENMNHPETNELGQEQASAW